MSFDKIIKKMKWNGCSEAVMPSFEVILTFSAQIEINQRTS